jgi:hypothetical protein
MPPNSRNRRTRRPERSTNTGPAAAADRECLDVLDLRTIGRRVYAADSGYRCDHSALVAHISPPPCCRGGRGRSVAVDRDQLADGSGLVAQDMDDWKKVFRDDELDRNLARMLHLDKIER